MLNEAFWFVYMTNLFDILGNGMLFVAIIAAIFAITAKVVIDTSPVYTSFEKHVAKKCKNLIRVCVVFLVVGILVPRPEAMYAGIGQHIAQQNDLTTTLKDLKRLIDQKINKQLNNDTHDN